MSGGDLWGASHARALLRPRRPLPSLLAAMGAASCAVRQASRKAPAAAVPEREPALPEGPLRRPSGQRRECRCRRTSLLSQQLTAARRAIQRPVLPSRRELPEHHRRARRGGGGPPRGGAPPPPAAPPAPPPAPP